MCNSILHDLSEYGNKKIMICWPFVAGVMQASHTGGTKLDKRYSPCFRDENGRKQSLSGKRKRDDVFKCVSERARSHSSRTLLDTCHVSFIIFQKLWRTPDRHPTSPLIHIIAILNYPTNAWAMHEPLTRRASDCDLRRGVVVIYTVWLKCNNITDNASSVFQLAPTDDLARRLSRRYFTWCSSFYRFKVHRNGNASEVLKSIAHMDNSNKQCEYKKYKA